jgi:hypothetical protein
LFITLEQHVVGCISDVIYVHINIYTYIHAYIHVFIHTNKFSPSFGTGTALVVCVDESLSGVFLSCLEADAAAAHFFQAITYFFFQSWHIQHYSTI